jgi:hypothetical protein
MAVKAVICKCKHKKEACRSEGRTILAADTNQLLKQQEQKQMVLGTYYKTSKRDILRLPLFSCQFMF